MNFGGDTRPGSALARRQVCVGALPGEWGRERKCCHLSPARLPHTLPTPRCSPRWCALTPQGPASRHVWVLTATKQSLVKGDLICQVPCTMPGPQRAHNSVSGTENGRVSVTEAVLGMVLLNGCQAPLTAGVFYSAGTKRSQDVLTKLWPSHSCGAV